MNSVNSTVIATIKTIPNCQFCVLQCESRIFQTKHLVMFTQHMDGYELSIELLFHHVDIGLNKQGYSYSPEYFLKFL